MKRLTLSLLSLLLLLIAATPEQVTVKYQDGSIHTISPLTNEQKQLINQLFPPQPPVTPLIDVDALPILSHPSGTVLDAGKDDTASIELKPGDAVVVQALVGTKPSKIEFSVNGLKYVESNTPWTYGLQFEPKGWVPKVGVYLIAAQAFNEDNKPGTAKQIKLKVTAASSLPPSSDSETGTYRWSDVENKWVASWTFPMDKSGFIIWPRKDSCLDVCVSISASTGGDGSQAKPFNTAQAAIRQLKNNSNRQFHLWLKENEEFGDLTGLPSGDAKFPNVVRTWGLLRARTDRIDLTGKQSIALVDLNITNTKPLKESNSASTGVWGLDSDHIAVEGCFISGWRVGISAQAQQTPEVQDILIHRNVIVDNHPDKQNTKHSQGIYTHLVNGFLDEDNVYDHNGFGPTQYNHNRYQDGSTKNIRVRNLLSSNASATGNQQRSGGELSYAVIYNCPNGITYGLVNGDGPQTRGGVQGNISHVLIEKTGNNINAAGSAGNALIIGNTKSVVVNDVYIMRAQGYALSLEVGSGVFEKQANGLHNLTIDRLQVFGSRGGIAEAQFTPGLSGMRSFSGNLIRTSTLSSESNLKRVLPGSTGSSRPGQGRGLDEYAKSIGLQGADEFIKEARKQSRMSWRKDLEPKQIMKWIEENN